MPFLRQDLTYALRRIRQQPLAILVVVLTLGLGIGASTAIFSLQAVLIRPLLYREPAELVLIQSRRADETGRVSLRELQDIREQTPLFADIAAYAPGAQYNLSGQGTPEELAATLCTRNLFSVLGIAFTEGSAWPTEYDTRRSFGIVLTHELWQRKYGADPLIVGKSITLDRVLGASPGNILQLILQDILLLSLTGVGVGLVAAGIASRTLTSYLHGISAVDLATYASVAVFFPLVALLAALVPAVRATWINPVIALKNQ